MALSGAGEPQTSYSWLVSLVQLGPAALPDVFAQLVFLASVLALLVWRIGTVKLMGF